MDQKVCFSISFYYLNNFNFFRTGSLSLHDISLRSKSQAAYNNQHSLSSLANKNNKLSTVDDENVPVGKVEPNDTHQKVSIADSKGKVMIDNLVNELKMPVEVSEDKIEEKVRDIFAIFELIILRTLINRKFLLKNKNILASQRKNSK